MATVEALYEKSQLVLDRTAGQRLAKKVGAVGYVECSALNQQGLEEVFNKVSQQSEIELTIIYVFFY